MKVYVCVDDLGGMLFNKRRVSRDRILIEDMIKDIGNGRLFISPFSQKLLSDLNVDIRASEKFLSEAENDDSCFVEDRYLMPFSDKIKELVIYRWNRCYPSDMKLDIEPAKCGLSLISSIEFKGSSHERITKEIYRK